MKEFTEMLIEIEDSDPNSRLWVLL